MGIFQPLLEFSARIANFFSMSHAVSESTPLLPFFEGTNGHLDSSPIDIPYWSQVVLALTTSPDLVKASVVEKLEWYKNGSGFRHEYLVAIVICPNHQKALLRFERCGTRD